MRKRKKYSELTEEEKERNRKYRREYYKTHKEKMNESVYKWRRNNTEKYKKWETKYNKEYYEKNKEVIMQKRRLKRESNKSIR